MAVDLTLLTSFADGQGAGAPTYVNYAPDHDSNYTSIQSTVNQLNAEVAAIGGQSATLILDLLKSPSSPLLATGFVDVTSFAPVSFLSGDTQIQIPRGVALTTVGKVPLTATAVLTGSGASGQRFVALQQNATVTLETLSLQGIMDLYEVTWNGAAFLPGTLDRLEDIMPGGHDFQNAKIQEDFAQGSSASVPAFSYDRIADRVGDIARILGGEKTSVDAGQASLGAIAIAGSSGAPGFILGTPGGYSPTTGLYTAGADALGITVLATPVVQFAETVANQPQAAYRAGSNLATPELTWLGDTDTGIGYEGAGAFRAVVNSGQAFRFSAAGIAHAEHVAGAVGTPGLALFGDPDTGLFSPGANQWSVATGGILALALNAQQQRQGANQGRVSASASVFNVANNATTAVDLAAEQYDVGTYHDTGVNPDRVTVPAGHDGNFACAAFVVFDESSSSGTPNSGDRGVAITVNGAAIAQARTPAAGAGDTSLACPLHVDLVATDIVRVTAFQDSGGTMDVGARLMVRHAE